MFAGLLDPSLLSDPDTLKALTPTCDPIKGTMQTASGTVDGVPTFPYTHTFRSCPQTYGGLA